jgi:hypothetical protein
VLIDALLALAAACDARDPVRHSTDSWMHRVGFAAERELLERLPIAPEALDPAPYGQVLAVWTAAGGVSTYDRMSMLREFVYLGDRVDEVERRALAAALLRTLRADPEGVDVEVRTTLVGIELVDDLEEVPLPFGRLVPGDARSFQIESAGAPTALPPAAVFTYDLRSPARLGFTDAFEDASGQRLRAMAAQGHEQIIGRALVALARAGDGPVQEHLTMRSMRFSGSAHGERVPPVAPLVTPAPYRIDRECASRLMSEAQRVAPLDMTRLTVAARLLLRARGERARPTDQLVDLHTAIEALSGRRRGHGRDLVAALAVTAEEATALDRQRRELSQARALIVHDGRVPSDVERLVDTARALLVAGIEAEMASQEGRDRLRPALVSVFPGAHEHVANWDPRRFDARIASPASSQALCVSVWGTLATMQARTRILEDILGAAGFHDLSLTQPLVECEVVDQADVLNELGPSTPTSLDALLTWPLGVLTIESKFTEREFGTCSQPRNGQCSGDHAIGSDLKMRTAAPCRLTVYDGARTPRLYWSLGTQLFRPEVLAVPRRPCPFAGASFQLMRNLAFAAALAARRRRRWFGFLVAYVGGAPSAAALHRELEEFQALLLDDVRPRFRAVTYEQIGEVLRARGENPLAEEIDRRIRRVCGPPVPDKCDATHSG